MADALQRHRVVNQQPELLPRLARANVGHPPTTLATLPLPLLAAPARHKISLTTTTHSSFHSCHVTGTVNQPSRCFCSSDHTIHRHSINRLEDNQPTHGPTPSTLLRLRCVAFRHKELPTNNERHGQTNNTTPHNTTVGRSVGRRQTVSRTVRNQAATEQQQQHYNQPTQTSFIVEAKRSKAKRSEVK